MGITQIATAFADLVQHRERVKLFWPHLAWLFFIFFLHLQEWWLIYTLNGVSQWRLPSFILISLYPLNLFVLARLLSPTINSTGTIDLRVIYTQHCHKLFFWTLASAILAMIDNLVFHGESLTEQLPQLALCGILAAMLISRREVIWLHQLLAFLLLLFVIGSMVVQWNEWVVG